MTIIKPINTVCVVDDDQIYVFGLRKLIAIKKLCPNLLEFCNGKDAIDFIQDPANIDNLPDVIFLDINMPIMDGWDFLDSFKQIKHKLGKKITVYMISSSINEEDINRAKSISDVTDYIMKPVTHDKLVEMFHNAA